MRTDALIERLAGSPPSGSSPPATVAAAAAIGTLMSAAIMVFWLGLRPDLGQAASTFPFWMKLFYALSWALFALAWSVRLARPTGALRSSAAAIGLPFALITVVAVIELATTSSDAQSAVWLGHSSNVCTERIIALSLPVLAAILFGIRKLAPTHLVQAGAVAGLLAGAAGTLVYALHCDESSAPFVALWYTLGIVSVGALGALLGRVLLRW